MGQQNFYVLKIKYRDIADVQYTLDVLSGRIRPTADQGSQIQQQQQQFVMPVTTVPDPPTHSLIIRTMDPNIIDEFRSTAELIDLPVEQVEIEVRLIQVGLDELRNIGLDWSLQNLGESSIDFGNSVSSAEAITSEASSFNINLQTIGPTRLSWVLNLISTLKSAEILSAPKILTLSDPPGPASISITQSQPYIESIDVDTLGDDDPTNNIYRPTFGTMDVGITLDVTPIVLGDGSVNLEITPVVNSVVGRVPVLVGGGGDGGSILDPQAFENLGQPVIDTSEVTTWINVEDGDSIVIGGLVRDEVTNSINSVPILGNIPILGKAFRDDGTAITKETLLIFVTVHVIRKQI
jgi:general secretion pathway protein D